jgi:hypothetical protein
MRWDMKPPLPACQPVLSNCPATDVAATLTAIKARSLGGQYIKIFRCWFFEEIDPPAGEDYIFIG